MRPGILAYDDHTFIFVCGNNVVIQTMELKDGRFQTVAQRYIPGCEGSQGISTLALSPCKRYLAVCERAKQAVCFIYDTGSLKRRKVLTSNEYQASEFVSAAFANTKLNDQMTQFLVTLTGEPDFGCKVWLFEKQRFVASYKFDPSQIPQQVSFNPEDNNQFVVTGDNIFRYLKITDTFQVLSAKTTFGKLENRNYTSHAWCDRRLLVSTSKGEILSGEMSGDFKLIVPESPGVVFAIQKIVPKTNGDGGFFIYDDTGRIKAYALGPDQKNPYQLTNDFPSGIDTDENEIWAKHLSSLGKEPIFPITGLEHVGDQLVYTTTNCQILKLKIGDDKPRNLGKVSFFSVPMHSERVTGIATCMKRHIVVTAGADKTIRVWSYQSTNWVLTLEICQTMHDEIYTVALHPSGNYLVASFNSSIQFFNIYPRRIEKYHEIPKGSGGICNHIKFTTHGNLVAIQLGGEVHVYRFFTATCPENYVFKGHEGHLRNISWTEDDSGLVTTGIDNKIAVWQLPKPDDTSKRPEPVWTYVSKLNEFISTVSIKVELEPSERNSKDNKTGTKQVVFGMGKKDASIHEVLQEVRDGEVKREGALKHRHDVGFPLESLLLYTTRSCFFGGVHAEGRPGSVVVVPYPFREEKLFELQVHSGPVTRMCLNYEHTNLFSASADGSFAFLQIADKSGKRGPIAQTQ